MLPIKGSVKKKSVPFVFPPSALLAQGIIHPWGAQYSRGQPSATTEPASILALDLSTLQLLEHAFLFFILAHACALLLVASVLRCGLCCAGYLELRTPAGLELVQISCLTLLNAGMTSILYFIFVQQMGSNHTLTFYRIPSE